jgi:hypothetical protein
MTRNRCAAVAPRTGAALPRTSADTAPPLGRRSRPAANNYAAQHWMRGTPAPLRPRNRCAASTLHSSCAGLTRASTARRVQAASRGSLDQARGRRKGDKCAAPVGRAGEHLCSPRARGRGTPQNKYAAPAHGSRNARAASPGGNRCAASTLHSSCAGLTRATTARRVQAETRGSPGQARGRRKRGTDAPRPAREQACRGTDMPPQRRTRGTNMPRNKSAAAPRDSRGLGRLP